MCVAQDIRVDATCAPRDDGADPILQRYAITDRTAIGGSFQSVRIAEPASRKSRRQPSEQPIKSALPKSFIRRTWDHDYERDGGARSRRRRLPPDRRRLPGG